MLHISYSISTYYKYTTQIGPLATVGQCLMFTSIIANKVISITLPFTPQTQDNRLMH